ncbi:MAG: mechanosensitive ion channel [Chitinivibrionales bacterium]|nr:mechanosensitive ion channel [Chitinivibrionales bacterium]MBD3396672.1 mechanosensitive ion channel [Chitinivibrionales bacterium]
MNRNQWLTPEFWQEVAQSTVQWAIAVLPAVLLILVLALVLLKIAGVLLKRLKPVMRERMREGTNLETSEIDKRVETLSGILNSAVRIAVWAVIGMLILRRVGIDVGPLIAGAGIVGLAVGFGAQELVRDFISGFFMLMENQIRTGDVAIVNGTGGLVEHVGLRTVVLRDLSGVVHVFQNGKVNTLSNMTKGWSAMVFDIGVAYKENTDKVIEVMQRVAEEMRADEDFGQNILEPMEIFGVDAFGDSAVVVKARLKTKPIQQWAIGREYRRRLKHAFDNERIEIPFPHRTVYWGEEIRPLSVKSQ